MQQSESAGPANAALDDTRSPSWKALGAMLRQDDDGILREWVSAVQDEGWAAEGGQWPEVEDWSADGELLGPPSTGRRLISAEECRTRRRGRKLYNCLWQIDGEVFSYQERTFETYCPELELRPSPVPHQRRADTGLSLSPVAPASGSGRRDSDGGVYSVLSPAAVTEVLNVDLATVSSCVHVLTPGEAIEVLELRQDGAQCPLHHAAAR